MEIYKITYGMRIEMGEKLYEDRVIIRPNGNYMDFPVYAIDNGSEYVEIITGTPIPKVIDDEAPGFGAYKVEVVVTRGDLKTAADYMTWIKESYLEEYKKEFKYNKEHLESIFDKFKQKHFDQFGRFSEPNLEREMYYQNELNKARKAALDIASEMIKGGKQFKK